MCVCVWGGGGGGVGGNKWKFIKAIIRNGFWLNNTETLPTRPFSSLKIPIMTQLNK